MKTYAGSEGIAPTFLTSTLDRQSRIRLYYMACDHLKFKILIKYTLGTMFQLPL
jgi:hypothetical protein